MAKSFSSIGKGLELLSFFPNGKYKDCRVDSIVAQDPAYIDFVRINYGTLFDKAVLEAVMRSHELRYEERSKASYKIKKYGLDGLFDNRHGLEAEYADSLVYEEDVPF